MSSVNNTVLAQYLGNKQNVWATYIASDNQRYMVIRQRIGDYICH